MLTLILLGFAIANLFLLARLWSQSRRARRARWERLDSLSVSRSSRWNRIGKH